MSCFIRLLDDLDLSVGRQLAYLGINPFLSFPTYLIFHEPKTILGFSKPIQS
jgi:hypothetical protein